MLAACVVGMPSAALGARADDVDVRMSDPRITESSGLALSRAHPHTVWTVNDSGDAARVFAVDTRTGATVGVRTFDAPVRDVEALTITPQGRMLVADIGDNGRSREVVRVFWFDEPALGQTTGGWSSWELAYPDGPHDAESLAVHPVTGQVVIVTKASEGAGVYALPANPSRQGVNRLTRLGPAPDTATDAVFLPDGSALMVRGYFSLHRLDARTWRETARAVLPLQPQGESLSLAPGGGLLVGSEGKRSRLQQIGVPGAPTPATPTAPTTTPTSVPTASSTSTRGAAARDVRRADGEGLLPWLVAAAGAVALAGVARVLRPRRAGRSR